MSTTLTDFEARVIKDIIEFNDGVYLQLLQNLAILKVESRVPTGVGAYINFDRAAQNAIDGVPETELGTADPVPIPGVLSGLGAVLAVGGGVIQYLELFTYDPETWDGNTDIPISKWGK